MAAAVIPVRLDAARDVPVSRWHFQASYPYWWNPQQVTEMVRQFGDVPIAVNSTLATVLRGYQLTAGYTPGPLLGGVGPATPAVRGSVLPACW